MAFHAFRRGFGSRREFLTTGARVAVGLALTGAGCGTSQTHMPDSPPSPTPDASVPRVAIVRAPGYADVDGAMDHGLSLLGGIGDLVRGKRVAVKVNLTGTGQSVLGLPAQETYVVHGATIAALVRHLAAAGAADIVLVESASFLGGLDQFAEKFGWDVGALKAAGPVTFENTRNLGTGTSYVRRDVPAGLMYDYFMLNEMYSSAQVYVSLAKMKNHRAAGVTLALKNMFGITPNALYGEDGPGEHATGSRLAMHDRPAYGPAEMPGEKGVLVTAGAFIRVPRTVVDLNAARPVHLAVIEAVTTMSGGEGSWSESSGELRRVSPGVLIMGRDAVATDAVAVSVMGYTDPLTTTKPPFHFCENHIMMAHEAGLGVGDLDRITVVGEPISDVKTSFAWV